MVDLRIEKSDHFRKILQGREVYCYGAGKMFGLFRSEYGDIPIRGIVDNYIEAEKVSGIPILRPEEFFSIIDDDSILVITSAFFDEIIDTLDKTERSNHLCCFLMPGMDKQYPDRFDRMLSDRSEVMSWPDKQAGDGYHFQIFEVISRYEHAGSKAPSDVRVILENIGYRDLRIHINHVDLSTSVNDWKYLQSKSEWDEVYHSIPEGSVLVLQNPFRAMNIHRETCIRKLRDKGVRIISLIHDMEAYRSLSDDPYFLHEYRFMIDTSDLMIVHNNAMKNILIRDGVSEDRIVILTLFDYLTDINKESLPEFEKRIVYAGSLEDRKCPFISELYRLYPLEVDLYGPDYDPSIVETGKDQTNVKYKGSFPPEEIPGRLNGGFGLIWDGDSLETCSGGTGEYLKYISPHKLSLYLVSGLPVIVWRKAAVSEFIKKNRLGIVIDSLLELPVILEQMSEEEYTIYAQNAMIVSKRLREGYYLKQAIQKTEHDT